MAPSGQDNVFITYNNPTELKSKQNRRTVSSFASKSYRPTSRRIVLDRTHYRPFVRRQDGEPASASGVNSKKQKGAPDGKKGSTSNDPERVLTPQEFDPRNECALGSPLADPFTTYPIAYKAYVPFLVDYCEWDSLQMRIQSLLFLPFRSLPAGHSQQSETDRPLRAPLQSFDS